MISGASAGIGNGLPTPGPLSVITSVSCTKAMEKTFTVFMLCFFLFGEGKNLGQASLSLLTSSRINCSPSTQRKSSGIERVIPSVAFNSYTALWVATTSLLSTCYEPGIYCRNWESRREENSLHAGYSLMGKTDNKPNK